MVTWPTLRPQAPAPGGNLLDVLTSDLDTDVDFLDRCHREHGGIVALTFAGQRQVFASSHELVAARAALPAGERPDDLLERMLTSADPVTGGRLSARSVRHQLATFLIACHETTSGLLSFAVHRLLAHPDVLCKAKEAVDEVLGDRVPGFADLARPDHLGQVLRETPRLLRPAARRSAEGRCSRCPARGTGS
ncbi:cytochrome P450 [Actinosynnema mirum]|uniref:cytochrome P450 n=1 Tax=Actinosynnema mirum TaxID=40567 RepID=UPI00019AC1AB|nr:cytochrome P450 [Actinosynnema mirum]